LYNITCHKPVETFVTKLTLGIAYSKFQTLFCSICTLLQLGNLVFASDPYNTESSIITSTTELRKLAELMGVPIESLTHALTSRTISARREVVQTQVTADRAKDACDALVEEIYHGTFLWLVHHINAATCQNYDPKERSCHPLYRNNFKNTGTDPARLPVR
jgi:myosin heavy subunit